MLKTFLPALFATCLLTLGSSAWSADYAEPMPLAQGRLEFTGTIVHKEEIWDRRSNPLMGRPDFLKEIRLIIAEGSRQITASIKGQQALHSFYYLGEGMSGTFYLSGEGPIYDLVDVKSVIKPEFTPRPVIRPTPRVTPQPAPEFPENLSPRTLKITESLRKKAVHAISERYHMSHAKILFKTGFQGPMPPEGGYQFWGVTGKVNGKWQVWQAGYKGLRPGRELIDPYRHQK